MHKLREIDMRDMFPVEAVANREWDPNRGRNALERTTPINAPDELGACANASDE